MVKMELLATRISKTILRSKNVLWLKILKT